MNEISQETIQQLRKDLCTQEEDQGKIDISTFQGFVGKKLFIRTMTYHLVGRVEQIFQNFLELSGASWVADSGRFMDALREGTLDEVEPVGQAFVNRESIVDMFPWNHPLPKDQK